MKQGIKRSIQHAWTDNPASWHKTSEENAANSQGSPEARPGECPFVWIWKVEVVSDGGINVFLSERYILEKRASTCLIAHYSATEMIRYFQENWNVPTMAACDMEGKLKRRTDELRHDLERSFKEPGACQDSLLETKVCLKRTPASVTTVLRGHHKEEVRQIAWHYAILACLAQANQYDRPYGGRVFDLMKLFRESTRDPADTDYSS